MKIPEVDVILTVFWVSLSLLAMVSALPIRVMRDFTLHGKLVNGRLSRLYVPKHWFYHFYLYGLIIAMVLGIHTTGTCLFTLHLARRLIEQVYLYPCTPNSRMHVSAYVFGFVYYTAAALTIPSVPLSVGLFVACNLMQFTSHRDLFLHRTRAGLSPAAAKRTPPCTILFRYMNCPHYLAEMLIYVSLSSPESGPSIACAVFVIVSLSVNWRNQSSWYRQQQLVTP